MFHWTIPLFSLLFLQIHSLPLESTTEPATGQSPTEEHRPSIVYGIPQQGNGWMSGMEMNPFRAMERMMAAMEESFRSAFGRANMGEGAWGSPFTSGFGFQSVFSAGQPCTIDTGDLPEISGSNETDSPAVESSLLTVQCNITGYEPDNVNVSVSDGSLVVEGSRVVEQPDGQNATAQFRQQLYLTDFDMSQMKSVLRDDGILTITAPRVAASRTIPITVEKPQVAIEGPVDKESKDF